MKGGENLPSKLEVEENLVETCMLVHPWGEITALDRTVEFLTNLQLRLTDLLVSCEELNSRSQLNLWRPDMFIDRI
ncbi:hypothetical protein MJO28_008861 [Puccinia striiformis f. sp. tritici]|uniref:Uncharacterized protein n=1 Tax=Puccinia striiformis f. sp. tritici TaxID=168172 RepID=A0ACC0EBT1_9BASI|nr:hypothetical protein MJO28_008861 [Puccinia striiformis f. sp. tritici]